MQGENIFHQIMYKNDLNKKTCLILQCRNCKLGTLDPKKVAGKIIVCLNKDTNVSRAQKRAAVESGGGEGVIIVQGPGLIDPYDAGAYPFVQVGEYEGSEILHYISKTK